MWPIVVFEVATERTEVKSACTTCDTCEMEKTLKIYGKRNLRISMSHYSERASALDFKDTSAPRFGHSYVVDLFLETCFFAFNRPLIQFL